MITHLGITQLVDQPQVQAFSSTLGWEIFQLPLEAYPGFWVYAYLVLGNDYRVLIDTGSGFGESNQQLLARFGVVSELVGDVVKLGDLTHVLITHGHIDHQGGLPYVCSRSQAKVGVHELDLRNIINPDEQIAIVSRRLERFLDDAGVSPDLRTEIVNLYRHIKLDYKPIPVDFTFEAEGMEIGPFKIFHAPGHSAGHVVIRLDDVLFSGDHVLSEISPHQAPEQLVLNTGLMHYLKSLDDLKNWAGDVSLVLGGHNPPITDLGKRLDEIHLIHHQRLRKILEISSESHTVSEISKILFGEVFGYNVLLALEETGAHVEYLFQRGMLEIINLTEFSNSNGHVPILYKTSEGNDVYENYQ